MSLELKFYDNYNALNIKYISNFFNLDTLILIHFACYLLI